jgi:hypothetical protein
MDYEKQREVEHARNAEIRAKIEKAGEILKFKAEKPDENSKFDCRVYLNNEAGEKLYIYFSAGYGNKRVNVSGVYPRNADGSYAGDVYYTLEERAKGIGQANYGQVPHPTITISPDKTPEQIARDIEKRFLPDYRDYRARVQAVVDAHNDYESTTAASLLAVKGAQLTEYEARERKFSAYAVPEEYSGARYEVKASQKEIDIDIHNITIDQARAIIALITKK